MERFEYVVVGAGSAGCIAAAELASDSDARVLLLEAGPRAEEHPETLSADGYKDAFVNDAVYYERFSEPQRGCDGRRIFLGTGRVLGGSGSVNGMVYTRGAREDFAEWPAGWRWDDVVSDFEAIERALRIRRREPTRWTEACISAAVASGFALREDLNDGHLGNVVGYEWMSVEGDRRRSSYVAYLGDGHPRPGLTVRARATVRRIRFDGERRAVAVEYEVDGHLRVAAVAREVVLCAGALETPKLLLLSGVGPGQALRFAGIDVVCDLPAVGANLHDHPNVPVFFRARHEVDCRYPQLYGFFRTNEASSLPARQSDTCYVFWPAPSAMKEAMQRMLPAQVLPERLYATGLKELVRAGVDLAFRARPVADLVRHLYGIVVILGKPRSRGSVRLRGPDPRLPARVDPAYFEHPEDLRTMVQGVEVARRLARSGDLALWTTRELLPGPRVRTQERIARWVEKNAITTFHFAGTCRMGDDPHSVVDTRLRVRGVQGLRVADASVIPVAPVAALNAASMLVGRRVARYLREEWR